MSDSNLQPKLWYDLTPSYVGHGRLELVAPELVAEGPAAYTFDEASGGKATLQVETADPAEEFLGRWEGIDPGRISTKLMDRCRRFSIASGAGHYTAEHRVFLTRTSLRFGGPGAPPAAAAEADVHSLGAEFVASPAIGQKYWVLPLYNMVSAAFQTWGRPQPPEIAKHPLRIFPTPDVPEDLSTDALLQAQLAANINNRLITFMFRGRVGFIESLPDYAERLQQLETGKAQRLITALMVCEAGTDDVNPGDPAGWFPVDILNVLSLAAGVRVGAPWIEFRDVQASLSRRVHITFGSAAFKMGHAAILEELAPHTGYLLTACLASPAIAERHVRITLTHLLNAGIRGGSVEDRFLSISRGYETLARALNLATQDLGAKLDPGTRRSVASILDQAATSIRSLAAQGSPPNERDVLQRIASRAQGASQTDKGFGESVASLADKFNLNDSTVLRQGYGSSTTQEWVEQLSELRGAAVHEGAFDFFIGRHNAREIVRICDHLHDLLLRIVLRILGSEAQYHSPIFPKSMLRDLDWVAPTTAAQLLIVSDR